MLAAALFVVLPPTAAYYETLPSVAYHSILRTATRDGRDGVVIAFLDGASESISFEQSVLNTAAKSFRCLPPGGVHALDASQDDRARFILGDFHEEHGLSVTPMHPPFIAFFIEGRPTAWHAGNWSAAALEAWAYSLWQVATVADEDDLVAFQREQAVAAIGFFPNLCEGDSMVFHEAVELLRTRGSPMPAAVCTNMSLGHDHLGGGTSGVVAVLDHGRGAWLSYPQHLRVTAQEQAGWLDGLTASGRITAQALQHEEL